MAKHLSVILRAAAILFVLTLGACSSRQALLPGEIPHGKEITAQDSAEGAAVAQKLAQRFPVDRNPQNAARVKRVLARMAAASDSTAKPWSFVIYQHDTFVNAAAAKGKFIFVWTGLLKFVQNDDELAAVLAHEISHFLAGHVLKDPLESASQGFASATAAMSQGLSQQNRYAGSTGDGTAQLGIAAASLTLALVSLGAQKIFVEPEEHRQELEADGTGLVIMAESGFNPEAALQFWSRMKQYLGSKEQGVRFLSTHPSSKERIEELEKLVPQAKRRYDASPLRFAQLALK